MGKLLGFGVVIFAAVVIFVGTVNALTSNIPGVPLSNGNPRISYFHDDARGVSCWLYGGTSSDGKAIDCIPDSALTTEEAE